MVNVTEEVEVEVEVESSCATPATADAPNIDDVVAGKKDRVRGPTKRAPATMSEKKEMMMKKKKK